MLETFKPDCDAAALRESFLREGVVVVEDAVPIGVCEAVIAATLGFMDTLPPRSGQVGHGIVPLHHAQALWDLRTLPAVHNVFAAIHGTHELLVSVDRVSAKPPSADARQVRSPLHWDCDPFTVDELGTQGLVYLTDTSQDQGPFCCVPAIYQNLAAYRERHAGDLDRQRPRFDEADVVRVPGQRGSLVVFHRLMPHSSELNRSGAPRYTQYVAMGPSTAQARATTAELWRTGMPPEWAIRQRVQGQQIPELDSSELTNLGARLAGVTPW